MSDIANSERGAGFSGPADGALEIRVFRTMIATVAVVVAGSAMFAPWRITTGLFLGGVLSLFNYHWLRSSIAAVFDVSANVRPRVRISGYIIRYFVVGAAVFAAYQLQVISLPATIAGLSSFVPALFVEAFRQIYFAIIRREESS